VPLCYVHVSDTDAARLEGLLARMGEQVAAEKIREVLYDAAGVIKESIEEYAPVRTGRLRESIAIEFHKSPRGGYYVSVSVPAHSRHGKSAIYGNRSDPFYANFVEYGHRIARKRAETIDFILAVEGNDIEGAIEEYRRGVIERGSRASYANRLKFSVRKRYKDGGFYIRVNRHVYDTPEKRYEERDVMAKFRKSEKIRTDRMRRVVVAVEADNREMTEPRPFLRPAFDAVEAAAARVIQQWFDDLLSPWNQSSAGNNGASLLG